MSNASKQPEHGQPGLIPKSKIPPSMKRYFWRMGIFMTAYMAILIWGLSLKNSASPPEGAVIYGLAILTALPMCAVFWTVFRLLVEMEDEYQRFLVAKQIMLATAITLCAATIWQFLNVYGLIIEGPQWFGAIWLASFGIAGGIVRWRA
ncbi:MAG: hypothetical protein ABJO01_02485 [Parasphingorhabdus sp.]|uniref:hypothetical protein n=1 Tax=Parasphingorhabdus sp. TaxID=2709688 RepID=UPI003297F736